MKQILRTLLAAGAFTFAASAASAACYADYKAKQDDPLRLHYGVARISACSASVAQQELQQRLARSGWTLMGIVSVFDETGLDERKPRAGQYFLRF